MHNICNPKQSLLLGTHPNVYIRKKHIIVGYVIENSVEQDSEGIGEGFD